MANGNKIPKKDAIDWVNKYKNKNPNSTHSILFDANIIQALLDIPGCVSIRIHFAENNHNTNRLILVAVDANGNAIRNAVMKACNKRHMNRKKMQEWLAALGNVKKANQKPLVIVLRSVMWKIDGKDPQGKIFSKQIRVDVPM